jgi:archaemetzincin
VPRSLGIAWYEEPLANIKWLARRLSEAYPELEARLLGEVRLPAAFFNPHRGQWISNQVLGYAALMRETSGVDVLLLVVYGDGYAPGLNFVFGHALLGGGAAVVYTERLRPEYYGQPPDQQLYLERLLKEALHELGHSFGLEHCPNPRCVMSFSNSIVEVDAKEPRYCPACAAKLEARGVRVSPRYILPG